MRSGGIRLRPVTVDNQTITALQKLITGDNVDSDRSLAPYRSGPALVDFFNQFGFEEDYGQGFPSRWAYAEGKLAEINGTESLKKAIEMAVDPRQFLGTNFSIEDALNYLNQFLEYDGYEIIKQGRAYVLATSSDELVSLDHAILENNAPNIEFIKEQTFKCKSKISLGDYDGAITNSRSVLEAVLLEIEGKIPSEKQKYNGDLIQLYRRVQKQLNLEPSRKDISDSLRQLLTGMVSIVNGLAPMRNKMSDSHARTYKPAEHHAKLAVNSVHTLCIFLLESFEYQVKSGHIKLISGQN